MNQEPYRYYIPANSENVDVRFGSCGVASAHMWTLEDQYAYCTFSQGGCLMIRNGKLSILPPVAPKTSGPPNVCEFPK